MKKKAYIKPMTQVVVLQQQYHLLAGSGLAKSIGPGDFSLDDDGLDDGDDLR